MISNGKMFTIFTRDIIEKEMIPELKDSINELQEILELSSTIKPQFNSQTARSFVSILQDDVILSIALDEFYVMVKARARCYNDFAFFRVLFSLCWCLLSVQLEANG